jgi:predicted GTPase
MATIRVYDPTAESSVRGSQLAPRLPDLEGRVVGILDNGKANAGVLMRAIADHLRRHYGLRDVVVRTKPVAGPASPETIRVFKEQADFVLAGSAD